MEHCSTVREIYIDGDHQVAGVSILYMRVINAIYTDNAPYSVVVNVCD